MFFKHVIRTFKRQWLTVLLLGVLLVVSGFIYSIMSLSVASLKEASESFFEVTEQEDFMVGTSIYVTRADTQFELGCSVEKQMPLIEVKNVDASCYQAIIDARSDALEDSYEGITIEVRYYKDTFLTFNEARHRVRVLKDMETINKSYIEVGERPEDGEIAVSRLYAELNNLVLGDRVNIGDQVFVISGFVLFPDYNLPIFEHLYMFDSANQTYVLMTDADFDGFDGVQYVEYAGVFGDGYDAVDFEVALIDLGFVEQMILTEHNPRSGAIYAELDGGQAVGLFLSAIIAVIGMVIVGVMVSKTMSEEKRTLGVLKALGVRPSEMVIPYVVAVFVFAVLSLGIGYLLGYYTAPLMQAMYLRFYLLPQAEITFLLSDAFIAIVVPTIIVVSLTFLRLYSMVHPSPVLLIEPKMHKAKPVRIVWLKKLLNKFDILSVLQGSMLFRQWAKVSVYVIGIVLGLYLAFLSLGMRDVFNRTMNDYYGEHTYDSVVYCDYMVDCDSDSHEKGLDIFVFVGDTRATLISIDADSSLYTLRDRKGDSVVPKVSEGLVISKSFYDLTRKDIGDTVTVSAYGYDVDLTIVAIADVYPGAFIYYDRAIISKMITGDEEYFNRLYTEARVETMGSAFIMHRTDMIEQLEELNQWYQTMIYVMVGASLVIAVIIIYLLSILTVEAKYYELSLFKVLGFNNREISKVLLGGYLKINVLVFIIIIPIVFVSFDVLSRVMVDMFGVYFPLGVGMLDILFAGILFGVVSLIGTYHAKQMVKRRSLQEALKIYQV